MSRIMQASVSVAATEETLNTIGSLARRARTSIDSIRFYERLGLIQPHARTDAGYRLYEVDALHRIAFIKCAQRCGISLAEIKVLLDGTDADSEKVQIDAACQVAREKQQELTQTIAILHAMTEALSSLLSWRTTARDSWPREACPLLPACASALGKHDSPAQLGSRR